MTEAKRIAELEKQVAQVEGRWASGSRIDVFCFFLWDFSLPLLWLLRQSASMELWLFPLRAAHARSAFVWRLAPSVATFCVWC